MTGATGRIGRLVAAHADRPLIRAGRRAGPGVDLVWDLEGAAPALPKGAVILHLAARMSGEGDLLAENLAMLRAVMRAAEASGASRVLVASSAAVYGAQGGPCREDGPVRPLSAYGRTKLACELAARGWAERVPVTVLRIGNVPGADALLGQGRQGPVTLDPIPGGAAGPVRSWIGPAQLTEVILALAERREPLPPCLNVAGAPPVAMGDLLTAAGIDWQFGPARAGVVPRVVLCTRRLQAMLPQVPVTAEGLIAGWRAARARAA